MNNENQKQEVLEKILAEAKKAPKRDYNVYSNFSSKIFRLGLEHKDGERALIKLAQILRV